MDLENLYDFITAYIDLCQKYKIIMVKCQCGDCDMIFPWEIDSQEDIDDMIEEILDWYVMHRQEIEICN